MNVHKRKAEIEAALKEGNKVEWIMSEYGCSRGTVCNLRKRLGLKRPDLHHENIEEIQDAIRRGVRWSAIIKTYGCAESTLSNYRKKLGYVNKIPSQGRFNTVLFTEWQRTARYAGTKKKH